MLNKDQTARRVRAILLRIRGVRYPHGSKGDGLRLSHLHLLAFGSATASVEGNVETGFTRRHCREVGVHLMNSIALTALV